jgi:flagellar basal-body rod protein FlgC
MNLFGILDVSGSALWAQRLRAEVITGNLANAESTRTPQGGPYVRKHVVFASAPVPQDGFASALEGAQSQLEGVRVAAVVPDGAPPVRRYDPSHPDADADGYVSYPAINPVEEMADLMSTVTSYQLNSAAVTATKNMIGQTIDLLK